MLSTASKNPLHNPRARFLVLTACGLTIIKLLMMGSLFTALMVVVSAGYLYPYVCLNWLDRFEHFCKKRRWNSTSVVAIAVFGALSVLSLFGHVEPASAQFFNKTETWMNGAIPGMPQDLVKIIFNVLRLVFVIYLGISLVKVIQSARDGEDWATLARTPGIVLVTVTLGDVLGGLITGSK